VLLPFLGDMVIALVAVLLLSRHYERLLRALGNRPVFGIQELTVAVLMVVVAIPVSLVGSALLADIRHAAVTWAGPRGLRYDQRLDQRAWPALARALTGVCPAHGSCPSRPTAVPGCRGRGGPQV